MCRLYCLSTNYPTTHLKQAKHLHHWFSFLSSLTWSGIGLGLGFGRSVDLKVFLGVAMGSSKSRGLGLGSRGVVEGSLCFTVEHLLARRVAAHVLLHDLVARRVCG